MLEHVPFIGDWHRSLKLGCGSFSDVWVWQHAKTKDKIVVKTCNVLMGSNAHKYKDRWQHEVELMTNKIHHPNVVKGIRVEPESFITELARFHPIDMPNLITEFCDGGDLRRQLNENRNASGMCESEVRHILDALKNAVFYLHSLLIIHRDIKPENIVIQMTVDGRKTYKLTDLGYTKPIDFRTIEANVVGKMVYIAPELITSDKYSFSADYWSIGVVVYEVITGFRPFVPHLPLAQWVLRVREKKSENITIIENNTGEFVYLNQIFRENRISNKLASLLENWFQLALEWNPKQRGCVFETSDTNQNKKSSETPPVQVLKFFRSIDDIQATKILTIFVLTNHKYLSFEIDENTTNNELLAFIERETNIPTSECHIIVSKENAAADDNGSYRSDKPIDLYIHDNFDKPMVFVAKIVDFDSNLPATLGDKNVCNQSDEIIAEADVPMSVQSVLRHHEQRLKLHSLRKFANDTLYFVRNENNKYKTCLDGWYNFSLQLNHKIDTCQTNVRQMQSTIYGVFGALELYKETLQLAQEKLIDDTTWFDQHSKLQQNVELLVNACDKITIRFGSVYRRCREMCQHELLVKRNTQDFYDIINVTKAYDILCKQLSSNNILPKPHFELFQCAYKCLKQRDHLLRNKAFIEMQRNLICIHIEFNEIKKALEKAVKPAEKYRCDLMEANKKLQNHIWTYMQNDQWPNVERQHASTSTSDLSNATHVSDANGTTSPNGPDNGLNSNDLSTGDRDQNIPAATVTATATAAAPTPAIEYCHKTKLLIEDNVNLRISMADLMTDFEETLTLITN